MPALSQTSASQLVPALISPWKRILSQQDAFFFVYCEQTQALSAANHCEANTQGAAAWNQGLHNQFSPVQLATFELD